MSSTVPTTRSRKAPLAVLLMVALLAAQWVGLYHRIVHNGGAPLLHRWASMAAASAGASRAAIGMSGPSAADAGWAGPSVTASSPVPALNDQLHHSCAAFEAATLGAALGSPPVLLAVVPNRHVLALWSAFASWQAPFVAYFSSRAPPCVMLSSS